jgi:hypothetical protein
VDCRIGGGGESKVLVVDVEEVENMDPVGEW